ncbi:galectin-4-like [Protobothrops mucrosquamatus]|uniref:galectin-4-like n=1 Tax=Protobothrops mucrosquamatus TaxID=103944 RepID=UPI0010FBB113|nr:galectin-4-like [Protobothrops mucrosquamatus]
MAFFPAPGYMPVYNPTLPYHQPVPGGLHPGMSVYVQGKVPKHTKRFRVNFASGQHEGADIPFHFNPRFDGKDRTVLNTFQCGRWGNEELHKMPFRKGEHFEIIFVVNDVGYQVLVDRNPFCSYGHRLPPQSVQVVSADGDLELESLTVMGGSTMGNMMMTSPAVYHPPVPYTGDIPGGLASKRTITIRGFIPKNASRFEIDLMADQNIVLHINPHMKPRRYVVRNSCLNGSWGAEENNLLFNPFQFGQYFEISICCDSHKFKVYTNSRHLFNFAHRYAIIGHICTMNIQGDVTLSYIKY